MSNDYFDSADYTPLARLTLARAEDVNAINAAIVAGFDLLPEKARLYEGRVYYCGADTGLANAYVVTAPYAVTLRDGMTLRFIPSATNSGASTLNASALGVLAVTNYAGNALTGGELLNGALVEVVYILASNQFRIVNPNVTNTGSVTVNNNVKASPTDTTPSTLDNKVTAQTSQGLRRTLNNSAGNENWGYGLDFTNLSALTDADDADRIGVYDNSATTQKYMTRSRFTRRPTLTEAHMGLM